MTFLLLLRRAGDYQPKPARFAKQLPTLATDRWKPGWRRGEARATSRHAAKPDNPQEGRGEWSANAIHDFHFSAIAAALDANNATQPV
jgi:hypothetical protein